jgi:hypothetical protein
MAAKGEPRIHGLCDLCVFLVVLFTTLLQCKMRRRRTSPPR